MGFLGHFGKYESSEVSNRCVFHVSCVYAVMCCTDFRSCFQEMKCTVVLYRCCVVYFFVHSYLNLNLRIVQTFNLGSSNKVILLQNKTKYYIYTMYTLNPILIKNVHTVYYSF